MKFYISCILFIFYSLYSSAQTPSSDTLYFNQVIELTLNNHPNIKLSRQRVEAVGGQLQFARGEFNTFYSAGVNKSVTYLPNTIDYRRGWLGADKENFTTLRNFNYNLGVSRKFFSGTRISTGLELVNMGRDQLYWQLRQSDLGNYITNRGGVYLSLVQPLFYGRGRAFNMANLNINRIELTAQQHQYVFDVSQIVLNALTTYIDYIGSQKNLDVQKRSEQSFLKSVRELEKLIELDAIPAADILFIKANSANQTNNRLIAENSLAYLKNLLGAGIGLPQADIKALAPPINRFIIEDFAMSDDPAYLDYWLEKSLENRQDYQALLKIIEARKVQVDVSQRRVQPRVDLNVNLGYNGIYEAVTFDQYYKPFIQNIPGVNYSVGLSFGVAPRYDAAKGELASAVAVEKQTESQAEALRNNILLNVKQYYDRVRYYSSVVASARQAIKFNETALNNEYTKLKLGSSTVVNVVQVQNNLVFSQTSLNQALQNLNQALLLFRFHTGTLVSSTDGEQVSVDYGVIFGLPERR